MGYSDYKATLHVLLEALTKHPDFKGIKETFESGYLALAATEALNILHKKLDRGNQAVTYGGNEDDSPILMPPMFESSNEDISGDDDEAFIIIPGHKPQSESTNDDDNFDIITY